MNNEKHRGKNLSQYGRNWLWALYMIWTHIELPIFQSLAHIDHCAVFKYSIYCSSVYYTSLYNTDN